VGYHKEARQPWSSEPVADLRWVFAVLGSALVEVLIPAGLSSNTKGLTGDLGHPPALFGLPG